MTDSASTTEPTTRRRWLRQLRSEAESRAERVGPLAGRIRPAQAPWSTTLDRLEALAQELAA